MKKYFKVFLVASVALNLFFAGMFFGHISHRFLWQGTSHRARMELSSQLPEDKRKLFKEVMHNTRRDTENIRTEIADAKKEAAQLLATEPFNESDYLTKVQQISDLQTQMKRHMAQAVVALAGQFTPEERAALADVISHPSSDSWAGNTKDDKN